MTLTQLTYIVAVDACRHFGRASEQCCVSQPTLSMQIRKLEEELGVQIFDRSRTPVRTTELGGRIVEQARNILAERDRMRDLLSEASGTVAGELRLGIIPTLAAYILPVVTAPFAERHPRVELVVHELTTERIFEEMSMDRLDAALVATSTERPGFVSRPLFREPFTAYIGGEHRLASAASIAPDDLSIDDMWLLTDGHCFRDQVIRVCDHPDRCGGGRPIRFESGSLETLCRLVDRVGGTTLLPYLATLYLEPDQRRHVRPFIEPSPYRDVQVTYRRAYTKRPLIEAYTEVVMEAVAPLLVRGL